MMVHRLREARESAGVSLRSLSRRTGVSIRDLRRQESSRDIFLSELVVWHRGLGVPLSELMVQSPDELDNPVRLRSALVHLMKSVQSLLLSDPPPPQRAIATNMLGQLRRLMPELSEITAWPQQGARRRRSEPTRIETQTVDVTTWMPDFIDT